MDNVDLEFEDDALIAVARKAIKLNTGARGLRSILENTMLDIMYKIPDDKSIAKVVITAKTIEGEPPLIVRGKEAV